MTELVAIDVGGTHARFALAKIANDGAVRLGEPVTLETGAYPGLEAAWADFAARNDAPLPTAAAISMAGPVIDGSVQLTNNSWCLNIAAFREALGLEAVTVLNDFGAVAHAVASAPADQLRHIAGPDEALPKSGTVSVLGPGTGLGIAYFRRDASGCNVQATEGGHVGFAPQDELEDRLLVELRAQYGRVATERVNAGPGIVAIYRILGGTEPLDDRTLWQRGLDGTDELASLAIDRFCASLGSTAGDYALAQGAGAVVLAGSLCTRLETQLRTGEFHRRFCSKPHYEAMMAAMPIRLIVHPQPGLYGAVAAFRREHAA